MLKAADCVGRIGLALIKPFYPSAFLQQFNCKPHFYRYGKSEVFHVQERKSGFALQGQKLLRFKIRFKEKRRIEKVSERHIQPLTHFMDDAEPDGIIVAIYHIAEC